MIIRNTKIRLVDASRIFVTVRMEKDEKSA